VSFDSEGTLLVVGSQTFSVPVVAATLPPNFVDLLSAPGIVLPNGDTLSPGAVTVVSGVTVSLSPFETEAVIGDTTVPLATTSTNAVVLPGGQTLTPGVLTTIRGVTVLLASSPTAIIIDGNTVMLTASASSGIGSYIWSGLGGATSSSTPAQYTGGADGRSFDQKLESWMIIIVAIVQVII
jgi:hypothetical protein